MSRDADVTILARPHTVASRLVELCREAATVLIAAIVAGVVFGGIGARMFMLAARLLAPERRGAITDAGNVVGEVTFAGSFFLVLFAGLITAVGVGVLMGVTGPWLAPLRRWEGVLVGWLALTTFGRVVLEPGNFDFVLLGDQVITVAMIVALGIAAGSASVALRNGLRSRLPMFDGFAQGGAGYLPAAILGVIGLLLVFGLVGASDAPSETAPLDVTIGVSFAALTIVTIADRIRWIAEFRRSKVLVWSASVCIVVLTTAGTARMLHDVLAIVP